LYGNQGDLRQPASVRLTDLLSHALITARGFGCRLQTGGEEKMSSASRKQSSPMVLFVLALGLLTWAFAKSRATSGSGSAPLETEGAMKVKHQVSNSTTNLRSRVVDDDVPGGKDETVSEEIIHMPPKSHHLKLPRAGSEGGESSAMIDSIVCACGAKCGSTSFYRRVSTRSPSERIGHTQTNPGSRIRHPVGGRGWQMWRP